MGFNIRQKRDGTGPHKESFRRIVEGKNVGRRIEAGETCPVEDKDIKFIPKKVNLKW